MTNFPSFFLTSRRNQNRQMQFLKSTFGGLIMVFIVMVTILFVREPQLLTSPNDWVIGDSYDGFRSYAAMHYHVRHDSTYSHYGGMLYPYGDKAAFTDNLPLVTNTIKFICRNFTDISEYSGGILNLALLLSIVLCAVFLYLSFRTLELPVWYSVAVSIGVTMLSPQLLRFSAHYGLANPFVIPLLFYLSLLFHKHKRWSTSFLIAFVLWLSAQLHFYLFALGGAFILALLFFKTLSAFSKKAVVVNGVHLFIQVGLPILALQLMLIDDVPARPSRPYGFLTYIASWESILLPVDFMIGDWISEYITPIRPFNREGVAYVGSVVAIFLLKEVLQKLFSLFFKKGYQTILPDKNRFFLVAAFWASLVIALFSIGLPFTFEGLEDLPNKLGPIAQFRSIGRFAWVTFYIINIIAFYAIYFKVRQIKKQGWQSIVFGIILFALLFEGAVFLFYKIQINLWPNPEKREYFKKEDNVWMDQINIDDYQAILTVPYYTVGSENIWMNLRSKEMQRSLWLSVQTGLPVNSSFMGRTSVNYVINEMELIAEPYRIPAIIEDFPNQKDFLVFLYKKAYKLDAPRYESFINGLHLIHEDEKIKVYRLSIEEIKNRVTEKPSLVLSEYQNAKLTSINGFESTDSLNNFVYQSFDQDSVSRKYKGVGAFASEGRLKSIAYDGHLPFQQAQEPYILSLWAYLKGDLNAKTWLAIEEYQPGTNYVINRKAIQIYKYVKCFDSGWGLSEIPFQLERPDSRIRIVAWNNDLEEKLLFLDELQIHPKTTNLYKKQKDSIEFNNRHFPL